MDAYDVEVEYVKKTWDVVYNKDDVEKFRRFNPMKKLCYKMGYYWSYQLSKI